MNADVHEPLEAPAVRETLEELYGRIEARFPKRGLLGVCGDLLLIVDQVQATSSQAQGRVRLARVVSGVNCFSVTPGLASATKSCAEGSRSGSSP